METIKGEVKTVSISEGIGKNKNPWTLFKYELSSGHKFNTFDKDIGDKYKPGMLIEVDGEINQAGYWEMKSIREADNTTQNTIQTPEVEKVMKASKVSRDGSDVTTGQILEMSVKLWISEKGFTGNFADCVTDVMQEFKRVREEFK